MRSSKLQRTARGAIAGGVVFVIAVLGACRLGDDRTLPAYPDMSELATWFPPQPLYPGFLAYRRNELVTPRVLSGRSIDPLVAERPDLALFNIRFSVHTSIPEALNYILTRQLLATHLRFHRDGRGGGELPLLAGYRTTPEAAVRFLADIVGSDEATAVDTYRATGFRAVLTEEEHRALSADPVVADVVSVYERRLQAWTEPATAPRGTNSGGDQPWTPGYHRVSVTELDSVEVRIRWEGRWTSTELDELKKRNRPAFETDITFRYDFSGGNPTGGYIYPDPEANHLGWDSNFGSSYEYLDTQFADGSTRAVTIGTTHPDRWNVATTYWSWVDMPRWNKGTDYYRYYEYELEHHKNHMIFCEGDGWCVGTFYLSGKTTDLVFSYGDVRPAPSSAQF